MVEWCCVVQNWLPMSEFRSNPDFLLGGRTSASAECRQSGGQSVGRAARFCLAVVVIRSQPPARQARGDWLWLRPVYGPKGRAVNAPTCPGAFDPSIILECVMGMGLVPLRRAICHGSESSDGGICRTLNLDWHEPEFGACSRQAILHFAGRSDLNFLCTTQEFSP